MIKRVLHKYIYIIAHQVQNTNIINIFKYLINNNNNNSIRYHGSEA